ncbi:MAG: hypothetical protein JETT_0383 [Candidatus Jettenia ecosi]|uniref:Uncharacterized protein n=1 Tax=Candidatus Jettenia ecosi TaxID=2494326 RepID=A0A533QF28_9BACT|nr:MAG: hypothetical protein JETT_0383 [Candidatus Jettenia ecosi]
MKIPIRCMRTLATFLGKTFNAGAEDLQPLLRLNFLNIEVTGKRAYPSWSV